MKNLFFLLIFTLTLCANLRAESRGIVVGVSYRESYDEKGVEVGSYRYSIHSQRENENFTGLTQKEFIVQLQKIDPPGYDTKESKVRVGSLIFVGIKSRTQIELSELIKILQILEKNPFLRLSYVECRDNSRILGQKLFKFYGLD